VGDREGLIDALYMVGWFLVGFVIGTFLAN
jgi:hypothetical protein